MKQTLLNRWISKHPFMACFRKIKKDERGVTAVEFALILPILLVTYMGTVEISQGLTVSRNTTNIASTVADLIGQTSNIDSSDVAMIFQASKSIISPFTSGNVQIIASSYCRQRSTVTPPPVGGKIPPNTTSTGIVRDWMQKYQATGSDVGDSDGDGNEAEAPSSITIGDPAVISLLPFNEDSLIVAETQYQYDFISPASAVFKVLFGSSNKFGNATGPNGRGSFTVKDRFFVRPRNARNVILDGATTCPN